MRTGASAAEGALALLLCLAACTSDNPLALDDTSYIGAWSYLARSGDGIETYARLDAESREASFAIRHAGSLWFRHCAYVGGDWPTCLGCEGSWFEEEDGRDPQHRTGMT